MISVDLFKKECKFLFGVAKFSQIPKTKTPQFAFWGRSNVGKSSLINTLVNRKNLVRVSNTPGRTKEINFFDINETIHLVDLPGYGFAKVPILLKNKWNNLVIDYFQQSPSIKRIFLLIDSRVGLKTIDFEVMDFLDNFGISYQIILTKSDKLSTNQLLKLEESVAQQAIKQVALHPKILKFSSHKRTGITELQEEIVSLILSKSDKV